MTIDQLKKAAAEKAVSEIKANMVVGLGTGSTVQFALEEIARQIKSGRLENIVGVPSSSKTESQAAKLGITLKSLNEVVSASSSWRPVDLTIDGADEVVVSNRIVEGGRIKSQLIKGGGGALLREKILIEASKRVLIIIDRSKLSGKLGEKFYLPVEVFPFAVETEKRFLEYIGARVAIRKDGKGETFITDNGNFILDANFGVIEDAGKLNTILNSRAGIASHGLFIDLADKIFCADQSGIKEIPE